MQFLANVKPNEYGTVVMLQTNFHYVPLHTLGYTHEAIMWPFRIQEIKVQFCNVLIIVVWYLIIFRRYLGKFQLLNEAEMQHFIFSKNIISDSIPHILCVVNSGVINHSTILLCFNLNTRYHFQLKLSVKLFSCVQFFLVRSL